MMEISVRSVTPSGRESHSNESPLSALVYSVETKAAKRQIAQTPNG
jgi:hypothetical protein